MNYTKVKKIYIVLIISGLLFRIASEIWTIDGKTGFINKNYYASGMLLSVLSMLCVLTVAILGAFAKGEKKVKIRPNGLVGIASLVVSVFSILDILTLQYSEYFTRWQVLIVIFAGILNATFFLYYAVMSFLKVDIIPGAYVVPLVFSIVKLIRFFAINSSITIITDNVFTVIYYALAILFMLSLARFACNIEDKSGTKKLFSTGLAASMVSILGTVPRLVKLVADSKAVAHESVYSVVLSLSMGVYILALTFKSFKD